jgi:hypothetical protein
MISRRNSINISLLGVFFLVFISGNLSKSKTVNQGIDEKKFNILFMLDEQGNITAQKYYSNPSQVKQDRLLVENTVVKTKDGGEVSFIVKMKNGYLNYITLLAPSFYPEDAPGVKYDFRMIKKDKRGNRVLNKSFHKDRHGMSDLVLAENQNGDFFISGRMNGQAGFFKVDSNGNKLWQYHPGRRNEGSQVYYLIPTSDGGVIGVGKISQKIIYKDAVLIICLDNNGNVKWEKEYGEPDNENIGKFIAEDQKGYVIAGFSNKDVLILNIDQNGDLVWKRKYTIFKGRKYYSQLSDSPEYVYIKRTNDSGYMVIVGINDSSEAFHIEQVNAQP